MYMVGAMIGNVVFGEEFSIPPHYLKLSRVLQLRGTGRKPVAFMAFTNVYIYCVPVCG